MDWSQVAADGGSGVLVVDGQGRILHINGPAARVFARRGVRDVAGLKLSDILPPGAAAERMDFARQAMASTEPLVVRDLWSGIALRCTWRKLDRFDDSGQPAALMVCCHETSVLDEILDSDARSVEAKNVDYGPLAALTASELRVMALIGEGLSNAEIAGRLHRAVKTVESHRAALTEKTGCSSRVQLGIMARRAGLARRVVVNDHDHKAARVGA